MKAFKFGCMSSTFFFLLSLSATGSASIFDFKDTDGYEKCLKEEYIVTGKKTETSSGTEEEYKGMDKFQIRAKCVKSAVKLLGASPKLEQINSYLQTTTDNVQIEEAIDFVILASKAKISTCTEDLNYSIISKCLVDKKGKGQDTFFARAKQAIAVCVKDEAFKTKFVKLRRSSSGYTKENTCELLKEFKVQPMCQ
ncbi:MAG: hypothetical protein NT027_00320 [Proteobacteria bacterium]|nr:hypothetical protein [Pseudomonadota bacterium]